MINNPQGSHNNPVMFLPHPTPNTKTAAPETGTSKRENAAKVAATPLAMEPEYVSTSPSIGKNTLKDPKAPKRIVGYPDCSTITVAPQVNGLPPCNPW